MSRSLKSLIINSRGWLLTAFVAVALSGLITRQQPRSISTNYLRGLLKKCEVASMTIVKEKFSIREHYTAEITLTPPALEKYRQLRAPISSTAQGPHFLVSAGSSMEEAGQWRKSLRSGN